MASPFLALHRHVMLALAACFLVFLCWAFWAKLDIVVTAQGKLVPVNFVQVTQPTESGLVRRVLVKDGENVTAGQLLVEMDPVFAAEDAAAATADVERLTARLALVEAELSGAPFDSTDTTVLSEYLSRRSAYAAAVAEAERNRDGAWAEVGTARQRQDKYLALAPVTGRQSAMLEKLKASGFVSEAAYNDKLKDHIETEREAAVQSRAVEAAGAQLRRTEASLAKVKADYQRQLNTEQADILAQLAQAKAEQAKRSHRKELTSLRAPVAGVVTGLDVHTVGQVVTAGTPLLSLVPEGEPLRFEGWLRNEDSAFALLGMPAKVKLAAYPFQKYGWLDGELSWLGVDSETPQAMRNTQGEPLFYRARITVDRQQLVQGAKTFPLRPGMQAVADLHVGTRSLFDYLTSPVRKIALEAAREH